MSQPTPPPVVVNGWTLFAHPLFLGQVEKLQLKDPLAYSRKNATKRLAAIRMLAFEDIPQDPGRPEYRQGNTLGEEYKHWCRVKFFQQYQLFFRYHTQSRVIVYVWVNDKEAKRACESSDDASRVFRKMLEDGNPPDDWQPGLVYSSGVPSLL